MSTDARRRPSPTTIAGTLTGLVLGAIVGAGVFLAFGDFAALAAATGIGVVAGAVAMATLRENEDQHWRGLYTARGQQLTNLDAELVRARNEATAAQREADNLRRAAALLQKQLDAERAKHTP